MALFDRLSQTRHRLDEIEYPKKVGQTSRLWLMGRTKILRHSPELSIHCSRHVYYMWRQSLNCRAQEADLPIPTLLSIVL